MFLVFFLNPAYRAVRAQQSPSQQDTAQTLARRILAVAGAPGTFELTVRNLSSLDAAQVAQIRASLDAQIREGGFRPAMTAPDVQICVTLSENLRERVWIAEVRRGDSQQVVMGSSLRANEMQSAVNSSPLTLEPKLIWQQAEPILDFATVAPGGKPPMLFVAERDRVDVWAFEGTSWRQRQSLEVPSPRARPRDFRGRLVPQEYGFSLFLSGQTCTATIGSDNSSIACAASPPSDSSCPLGAARGGASAEFSASANYFTGSLKFAAANQFKLAPFFSGATLGPAASNEWVLAGTDGVARLYESSQVPSATFPDWGSEIAALQSACGRGIQILATGTGDWTQTDTLRAYEVVDHQAVAVGAPLELEGPVVALWPEEDGRSARMVVHNLHTRFYEASLVSIHCNH